LIYVDESWLLRRELSSSLYAHSAEQTRWALIYVFATHVNQSETQEIYREIDWFTASCKRVDVQKLSRAFAVCMCVMYMSYNVCAKTLLSFCVYEQRLCCVFAVYVIAMHVNWSDKSKNRSIYYIMQTCKCAKAESCLCNVCMCDVYELQRVRKDVAVILCIWAKTVLYLRSVCICDACKLIRKSINSLIYCVASMCMCAKAESCLRSICVYVVYELQRTRSFAQTIDVIDQWEDIQQRL